MLRVLAISPNHAHAVKNYICICNTFQIYINCRKFTARTKEAEYEKFGKQDVVVISSVVPDQLVIDPLSRDSYAFITSISDDVQKATKQFLEGISNWSLQV